MMLLKGLKVTWWAARFQASTPGPHYSWKQFA